MQSKRTGSQPSQVSAQYKLRIPNEDKKESSQITKSEDSDDETNIENFGIMEQCNQQLSRELKLKQRRFIPKIPIKRLNIVEQSAENTEALTPTQLNGSRNMSSMGQRCTDPVEVWSKQNDLHKIAELETSTQKRSTMGNEVNVSWIKSVNGSELGDWKNDDSLMVNSLVANPIYDVKIPSVSDVKMAKKLNTEHTIISGENELQLKELDSIVNTDEKLKEGDNTVQLKIREANISLQQDHDEVIQQQSSIEQIMQSAIKSDSPKAKPNTRGNKRTILLE